MSTKDQVETLKGRFSQKTTAVVITTAMLTFVSYWRAASVVLCDLGSSAFYACGIAEQAIGKAAPWFIIAIMCFSLCVRGIYMESCSMFTRGGVYRVVKKALGATLGKISVSALLFDYALTGPISAVSAGHYLAGFMNQLFALLQMPQFHIPRELFAVIFAFIITVYFWRKNVIGVHESSGKSLRIVQLSVIIIGILFVWSIVTLLLRPVALPPFVPVPTDEAMGWLKDVPWIRGIGLIGICVAMGHSILAMSGEESLAQLYRELAYPKIKNLKRAAWIIFAFSFLFTGIVSLFAVMIIPDEIRATYYDNLLAGLSMYLAGPTVVKMVLQGFLVVVGAMLLSGAVNTAMVGANGALNRLGEDGVFAPWFRRTHKKYGTTSRFIGLIAIMQLCIISLCRGDVYLLGEAYAFGVIWCFVSQTLAVLVLRWRDRTPREFTMPVNIMIRGVNFPIGISVTFFVLFFIAIANLFTKTIATKFGIAFTLGFYVLLKIFEYTNKRKPSSRDHSLEEVNLEFFDKADAEKCGCRHQNRVLIAVRDPNNLSHLKELLEHTDSNKTDILVMTVKQGHIAHKGTVDDLPTDERQLLTNIVAVAEKHGSPVIPIMVPAVDPMYATAKAAFDLGAQEIVLGRSLKTSPEVQLENLAMAWGFVTSKEPRKISIRIIWPGHELKYEIG